MNMLNFHFYLVEKINNNSYESMSEFGDRNKRIFVFYCYLFWIFTVAQFLLMHNWYRKENKRTWKDMHMAQFWSPIWSISWYVWWCRAVLISSRLMVSWAAWGVLPADGGRWSFSMLSTGETALEVLCPVLGSPAYERHGATEMMMGLQHPLPSRKSGAV